MAFLDTLFTKMHNPKPSLVITRDNKAFEIVIFSNYYLADDVIDVIVSVVKADTAKRIKPKDIAIDIIAYTGIVSDVQVIQTSKGIRVLIGKI